MAFGVPRVFFTLLKTTTFYFICCMSLLLKPACGFFSDWELYYQPAAVWKVVKRKYEMLML